VTAEITAMNASFDLLNMTSLLGVHKNHALASLGDAYARHLFREAFF
jgi:hypothetical protein